MFKVELSPVRATDFKSIGNNKKTPVTPFRVAFGDSVKNTPALINIKELLSSKPNDFKKKADFYIKDGWHPSSLAYRIFDNCPEPKEQAQKLVLLVETIEKTPKYTIDAKVIAKDALEIAKITDDKALQKKIQNKIKELDFVRKEVPPGKVAFYLKNIYGKKVMKFFYNLLLK